MVAVRARGERTAPAEVRAEAALDIAALRNEDFVSYKISVLSRILDRGVDRRMLAGLGLPLTSLRVLGHLHSHGEGRVLAIARRMHMLGSQVSKSMMALVEHGLVQRCPDPRDRRGTRFALTPEGRALYEDVLARAAAKQREVAALIGADGYRQLSAWLDVLIAGYGDAPPEGARPELAEPPTSRPSSGSRSC
jgi:DNA-binding MarR family transcriptional regulator